MPEQARRPKEIKHIAAAASHAEERPESLIIQDIFRELPQRTAHCVCPGLRAIEHPRHPQQPSPDCPCSYQISPVKLPLTSSRLPSLWAALKSPRQKDLVASSKLCTPPLPHDVDLLTQAAYGKPPYSTAENPSAYNRFHRCLPIHVLNNATLEPLRKARPWTANPVMNR